MKSLVRFLAVAAFAAPSLTSAQVAQVPPVDPNAASTFEFRMGGVFVSGERGTFFRNVVGWGAGSVKGFDGLLRGDGIGLSGRYLEGTFKNLDIVSADANVLLLPRQFSLVVGGSRRAVLAATANPQANRFQFARVGVSSTSRIGGSGLQAQVSGAYYVPFGNDVPKGAAASTATTMTNGMEGEAVVFWSPPGVPFYAQFGYRVEILNTKTGTATQNAEQVRGLRLGGGFYIGGK